MEDNTSYFWNRVRSEWSPYIYLERIAGHIYGDYLVHDLTFEEMMDSVSSIHRLEALLQGEEN